MSTTTDDILREALERITAGRILSSGNLTTFLLTAANREGVVSARDLTDGALRMGLYSGLGRNYQHDLNSITDAARSMIIAGAIQTSVALRLFLEAAAPACRSGSDPYKVENDLLIDARQRGLYEILPEPEVPLAVRLSAWPETYTPAQEVDPDNALPA